MPAQPPSQTLQVVSTDKDPSIRVSRADSLQPQPQQGLRATNYSDAGTIFNTRVPPSSDSHIYELFVVPPGDAHLLDSLLGENESLELDRNAVLLYQAIGSGEYGVVHRGEMVLQGSKGATTRLPVAVKTLTGTVGSAERTQFLQEAATMLQFSHSNVVSMIGMVTKSDPMMIVMEFMSKGLCFVCHTLCSLCKDLS